MQQQIIKLFQVKNLTGLSGSTIYRLARLGTFPTPIKLSERSSGWIAEEVNQWLDDKITSSRKVVM
ncbi:MAG: AlpA family phage regulatory protein [Cycloclasticus sp.]|nr:AlpA family phage regulatory protein [Cycloclasticus sp.]